ncbi:MAG: MFS transporter, partial [Pseudomonas sp.]
LVTGFDKMFNVYMRSTRQRVIPVQDFGKTVGVITLFNNLAQPLAGLAIAVLAAPFGTQTVILLLTGITALIGVAVASGWHATVKAELDIG